jgi:DNA-binding NtrC family response regulator
MHHVLLVEDHAESRRSLAYVLAHHGYKVHEASNGRAAIAVARRERLHALILDLKLPDMDGLAVLDAVQEQAKGLPALVVTAYGSVDTAVEAMKCGATDFITKPIDVDRLLALLERGIAEANERGDVRQRASDAMREMDRLGIVGRSTPMLELFDTLKRVAPHQSTVLVTGESGTGKELIARALHMLGPRAAGPFVAINCATLSEQILESELFGHERGAFTSADRAKEGVMETAHGGTLFLDEVNEIGLGCQAKLLRAIERHEFRRVGGTKKIEVDCNVIAASNADLERCVADGRFRADLYYRLKVLTIVVPPLRERPDAIPALVERFVDEVAGHTGLAPKRFTPEALGRLTSYEWPGNVRELKNTIESLMLMVRGEVVDLDDLPPALREAKATSVRIPVGMRMADVEREVIRLNLESHPTIRDAARALGIGLRTMHDKIRRYGLRAKK